MTGRRSLIAILAVLSLFALGSHEVRRATAQATPCTGAEFDKMEVTQAIQTLDHDGRPDNAVGLVGERGTTVRVYMKPVPLGCGTPVYGVGGMLNYKTVTTSLPELIGAADNELITVYPDPVPGEEGARQRRRAAREAPLGTGTLNYTFLAPSTEGADYAILQLAFRRYYGQSWGAWQPYLLTNVPAGLYIAGVPVPVKDENGIWRDPTAELNAPVADAMVWAVWPFPEPRGIAPGRSGYRLLEKVPNLQFESVFANEIPEVLFRLETTRKNPQLISPTPDYLFAWLNHDAAVVGQGAGCARPGLCSAGFGQDEPDFYKGTLAHELHHLLWRTAQEGLDMTIAPEIGWDVFPPAGRLGLGLIQTSSKKDIRVQKQPTNQRWIAAASYEDALDILTAAAPVRVPTRVLGIGVSEDLTALDGPFHEYDRIGPVVTPCISGTAELRIVDMAGGVLYMTRLDSPVIAFDDDMPPMLGKSYVEVPALPGASRVELYNDGLLQDARVRSAHAPSVTITAPLPGQVITESVAVEWLASDADGETLQAAVAYSPDGDIAVPLGVDLPGSGSLRPVSTGTLPSSASGMIRVVVTDGFNVTVATADRLQLGPNRPPQVWLSQPVDGATYPHTANVMLVGGASDPEDGTLPSASVSWFSDLDGFIGNGFGLNVADLSPGVHRIEFRAVDSASALAVAAVTITVD